MTTIRPVITVHAEPMRKFAALVQSGLGGGGGTGGGVASGGASNPFEDWRRQTERIYSTFVVRRFNQFSRGGGDWPALALSTIKARAGAARGRAGKGGGSGEGVGARSSLGRLTVSDIARKKGISKYDANRVHGPLGKLVGAAGRTVSILTDTGILRRAVGMEGAGHRTTRLVNGIQYGFTDQTHGPGKFAALAQRRAALAKQISSKRTLTLGTPEATRSIKAAKARHALLGSGGKSVTIGELASFHHFGMGHNPVRRILVEPDPQTTATITRALDLAVRKAIAISRAGGAK